MPNEHFIFLPHLSGSYPTFTSPTAGNGGMAIPVTSVTLAGSRALDIFDDTGATTRARAYKAQGAVNATGSVTMRGYPLHLLPFVFRSFLTDVDVTPAAGYVNDLLPNDSVDVQLPWFSMQKYYSSTVAENVRGAVVQKITLAGTGGEAITATFDFIAADIARAGGTWSDDITASPGVVGSIPYPSPMPRPFRFHEGAILLGGSASKSGNKLSSSGSAVGTIESFQLEITLNTEGRFAIRDGDPTIGYTRTGKRDIVFTGEIDWANLSMDYYDDMLAAAETVVRLEFVSDTAYSGSENYELYITLPRMVWPDGGAPTPQLDGVIMPKKQSLRLMNMEDITTTNTDIGVTIQTLDDLT